MKDRYERQKERMKERKKERMKERKKDKLRKIHENLTSCACSKLSCVRNIHYYTHDIKSTRQVISKYIIK